MCTVYLYLRKGLFEIKFENFKTNFVFVSEKGFADPSFRFVATYSKAGASAQW